MASSWLGAVLKTNECSNVRDTWNSVRSTPIIIPFIPTNKNTPLLSDDKEKLLKRSDCSLCPKSSLETRSPETIYQSVFLSTIYYFSRRLTFCDVVPLMLPNNEKKIAVDRWFFIRISRSSWLICNYRLQILQKKFKCDTFFKIQWIKPTFHVWNWGELKTDLLFFHSCR